MRGSFESAGNMYPRVKVRKDEEAAAIQKEERSYTVRAVESLHLESHLPRILVSTHGSRSENDIQLPRAKISNPRQNNPLTRASIVASNGNLRFRVKNSDGADEEYNKTYIKARPVPPPRAVLSSPDNDGIIGNQNQRIQEKRTTIRRQKLKSDGEIATQIQNVGGKKAVSKSRRLEVQGKLSSSKVKSLESTVKASNENGNGEMAKGKHSSDLLMPKAATNI